MRKSFAVAIAAAVLAITGLGVARGQKSKDQVVYLSANKASFKELPNGSGVAGAVGMEALWGEADKGAHGTITKFPAGYDAGMHSHTSTLRIVGIKGAYVYKDEAGEKRVGPGDYLVIPGGHKHWSGGDKSEGALFYEESIGKFDSVAAK